MTFGDIIEKILGVFGIPPARERKLLDRIRTTKKKVVEMEENRNTLMRTNTAIGEKIADLKRKLQVETNETNQDMSMDQVDEYEKDLERKQALAQQMGENITAQRAIAAKLEQLLEDFRHGADPVEIEMLMERVEDMVERQGEAKGKADQLDGMGRKARSEKSAGKESAARAARRAAMLGTTSAAPAAAPAPAKKKPAAAAPAAAPKPDDSATPAQGGTVAVG